jgi:hypothetical protein
MLSPDTYCSLAFTGFDSRTESICCFSKLDKKYSSFNELNESQFVDNLRNSLLNGIKHNACHTCWDIESAGGFSMRQQRSAIYRKQQKELLDEIQCKTLKYLVLDTGNSCNIACRTCGPTDSSGLFNEFKLKGIIPIVRRPNYNVMLDHDLNDLVDILVLGGEPFLNTDHIVLLEKLINIGRAKYCSLSYSTNGTIKINDRLKNIFQEFNKVVINYSIDAVGKPFEYIRTGANWQQVQNNIDHTINTIKPNCPRMIVSGHSVLSALNILYLVELYDWFDSRRMVHTTTYCDYPKHYSYSIFNDSQRKIIKNKLSQSKHNFEHSIKILDNNAFNDIDRLQFDEHVKFTESVHNLTLSDCLPELQNLLNIV